MKILTNLANNLADLFKVKTIVTLLVMVVFVVMSLRGDFEAATVENVVLIVIAFYFGTQHEKAAATKAQNNIETAHTIE